MIERCPCCNAQLKSASICPRCEADLSHILKIESCSQQQLFTAMQLFFDGDIEQSSARVNKALWLKKTQEASLFREFLVTQQTKKVVALLADSQLLMAKKSLYAVRQLTPYSKKLQKLELLVDYYWLNA